MRALNRYTFTNLSWKHNYLHDEIQLKLENVMGYNNLIFIINNQQSISELKQVLNVSYPFLVSITVPPSVSKDSNLHEFLLSNTSAQYIAIKTPTDTLYIRNKASDLFANELSNLVNTPQGIYQEVITQLIKESKLSTEENTKKNSNKQDNDKQQSQHQTTIYSHYFIQYYLRLHIQAYLRHHNINQDTIITDKDALLHYIMMKSRVDVSDEMHSVKEQIYNIESKIKSLEQTLARYYQRGFAKLSVYRMGLIGVGMLHLATFAYMIFFVDWLGWDIVEPLTFSVGCLYFLIGMRFYKKVGKVYNSDHLIEWCMEKSMHPKDQIQMQLLKKQIKHEQDNLRSANMTAMLYRNKCSYARLYSTVNDL